MKPSAISGSPSAVLPLLSVLALAAGLCCTDAAHAGATTDGSVGAVQTLSGAFTVPQSLGALRGANLFHSFSRFSIASGESATFTTLDPGLRHVIARVTGGEASLLQGPLALVAAGGAKPDFFLVNPSGIVVGAGASFDVPGALHLSTAPTLRFADGSSWSTGSAAPSTLTIAAPESFGFLGGSSSAAALRISDATLAPAAGSALSLSGGTIELTRVDLSVSNRSAAAPGALSITAAADLRLADTRIASTAEGNVPAGNIELRAGGDLSLTDATSVFSSGGGNQILIAARSARLDGSLIQVLAPGEGLQPGRISVSSSGALELSGGAEISTLSVLAAQGNQAVTIASGSLKLDDSLIGTTGFGDRDAGGLSITASGEMLLRGTSRIYSATGGAGPAGTVAVRAGTLRMIGRSDLAAGETIDAATGITSQSEGSATGQSGAIDLQVGGGIELTRQAIISASTQAQGNAGTVTVRSASLALDGAGLPGLKGIYSNSNGALPDAGRVDVRVSGELTIRGGAGIGTETASAAGRGGDVVVRAASLAIDGAGAAGTTGVFAGALPASSGRVGTVDVGVSGLLSLAPGASISIANQSQRVPAQAFTPSLLRVDAGQLQSRGGEITASSVGVIAASGIRIASHGTLLLDASAVRTSAVDGNGGNIDLAADGRVMLRDTRITTSVSGTSNGNGGDIRIAAPALVMASSAVQANTTAPLARGGTVVVAVDALVPDGSHVFVGGSRILQTASGVPGANIIQAAAPDGVGGTLNLAVPQLDLSGQLAGLNAGWIDFGGLGLDACLRNERSTFAFAGRGALPAQASQVLRFAADAPALSPTPR